MKPLRLLPILVIALSSAAHAEGLNLGDPAPALLPAKWIKGAPLKGFEKGRVYVVEFWATWCEPCKAAIPHLTEMATRYRGKVDFVGVAVWEGGDAANPALPKVEAFVKSKGAAMDYRVAADAPDDRVANSWLKASGERGIPAAFVVDQAGRIAAIVNSPDDLAKVLPKVLDGTLDVAAMRAQRDRFYAPYRAIQKSLETKDYAGTVKTIDALAADDPAAATSYNVYLYMALAHLDPAVFEMRARDYLTQRNGSTDAYNMLCAIVANENNLPTQTLRFGVTLAEEGAKQKVREALFLSIASELSESLGDRSAALRYAEATVRSANADPNCTEDYRVRMRKRLAELRAKRGAG